MTSAARRYHRSSSFQMAALFTVLLGIATANLGYFLYTFNRANLVRETEAVIDGEVERLREWHQAGGTKAMLRILADIERRDHRRASLVTDTAGKRIGGGLSALPRNAEPLTEGLITFRPEGSGRTFAAKIDTLPDGTQLLVARDVGDLIAAHERIVILSAVILILMAAVVGVSFLISYFVVSRTNVIAATAQRIIDTGDLSQRIEISSRWDDLSHVAHVLNLLLARVETLMAGVKQVSNNIAHDLRTPLTRLRNRLEALHRDSGTVDAHAIEDLIAEADGLLATFGALMRISSLDAGSQPLVFETVEMEPLLRDVFDLYEPLAEARGQTLTLRPAPARVLGQRNLLFQAFANLLDNAVKFTSEGGSITLSCEHTPDGAEVGLHDSGPGIPESERERVFERFYRAEASRRSPGNGLGLSLVASILKAHGATISLGDAGPGLAVSVRFPVP